jgi:hypothetical protein
MVMPIPFVFPHCICHPSRSIMRWKLSPLFAALLLVGLTTGCLGLKKTEVPHLVTVKKIWHGDHHNAFTDLIRFHGNWFCTFRESAAHVGGNGKIRLLTSKDGNHWESAALLSEEGIDLRDPKLSITPDDRLMLVLGGSVYQGKTLKERQSRVAFSKDGKDWTAPERVLEKGDWLWRVTWFKGKAYGIAYGSISTDAAKPNSSSGSNLKLVVSDDGKTFKLLTNLDVPDSPNESTLRFLANGDCIALVRRERGDKTAWIGTSSAPYTQWKWQSAGMQIGGPNFIELPKGHLIASGRCYDENNKARTFVGRMDLDEVQPDLILPSGGDCSYPGMVWHSGLLWLSYYSTHEGATDIYLAKIRLGK